MVPLGVQLGLIRADLKISVPRIAAAVGVTRYAVYAWANGVNSPSIRRSIAYASAVGARIVARRNGVIVAELEDIPANLVQLRQDAGVSQRELAALLYVGRSAPGQYERIVGLDSYLDYLHRYLEACGYELGLAKAVAG